MISNINHADGETLFLSPFSSPQHSASSPFTPYKLQLRSFTPRLLIFKPHHFRKHTHNLTSTLQIQVIYMLLKRPLGLLTQLNIRRQFHLLKNTNSQKLPNHGLKQLNTKCLPFFITSASPIQSNLDQMDQWPLHTLPYIILHDEKYIQNYKYKYKYKQI